MGKSQFFMGKSTISMATMPSDPGGFPGCPQRPGGDHWSLGHRGLGDLRRSAPVSDEAGGADRHGTGRWGGWGGWDGGVGLGDGDGGWGMGLTWKYQGRTS